ncbi:MAG: hypothetical protein AVDCRST_MAG36-1965, partial [uncultured Nocardioidaceae bacterium]
DEPATGARRVVLAQPRAELLGRGDLHAVLDPAHRLTSSVVRNLRATPGRRQGPRRCTLVRM